MRIRYVTAVGVLLGINFYTIPGSALTLGMVSHEYVKQMALLVLATFLIVWCAPFRRSGWVVGVLMASVLLFCGYASLTLVWSGSVVESLRFINKLWLATLLIILVAGVSDRDRRGILRTIEVAMVSYLVLTVASELLFRDVLHPHRVGDPRLAGFGDIHGTKYLMSIVTVYGFSLGITSRRIGWLFVCAVAGVVVLLSLQRAIIAATFLAIVGIILLEAVRRRSALALILSTALVASMTFGGFTALFEYAPLRDRMFANETNAQIARRFLLSGRLLEVYGLVQLRGRDEFWAIAGNLDVPFGGLGYGMAAATVEGVMGERWELHNDYLKLSVEGGPVAVGAYALLVVVLLSVTAGRAASTRDPRIAALYLAAFGSSVIVPLNGMFDNALDHVQKNLLYGVIFFLVAEALRRQDRRLEPDA